MLSIRLARFASALVVLSPLSGAGILTVGPAGSGAQFTQIQAAIDAALDDDVILVQPGTYQQIVVARPLRILGDGTGVVRIQGREPGATILGIGAGREVVLSGVEVGEPTDGDAPAILLRNCPGTVILDAVDVPGNFGGTAVQVQSCARAVVLDSQLSGVGAMSALDSEVWLANVTLVAGMNGFFGQAVTGVSLQNSTLHAWSSRIVGGDAHARIDEAVGPGAPGLLLVSSHADLFGGPGSELLGGRGDTLAMNTPGGAGLRLFQSSARIQASITISGGLDGLGTTVAPAISADATSTYGFDPKVFPTLVAGAQEVQLGTSFDLTLTGNPGGYQVLFLSLHTGPTTTYRFADGFGLLDRATMVNAGSVVLPPSGVFAFHFNVPNNVALLGSTLFFQAAEKLPNASILRSSGSVSTVKKFAIGNPVLVTITR